VFTLAAVRIACCVTLYSLFLHFAVYKVVFTVDGRYNLGSATVKTFALIILTRNVPNVERILC
jgi:hypothetical protein